MTTDRLETEESRPPTPPRRRPRDRKAQIVKIAARAFSERGYHSVGVGEIAAELGISGPALYRHFPNKHALFAATAELMVTTLLTAAQSADDSLPPADQLSSALRELISVTIENRRSGGLYRWEARYLDPPERERLRETYSEVNDLVARPVRRLRPEASAEDCSMLAAALLSVIGSITAHRTALATGRLELLLLGTCQDTVRCDLPRSGRALPLAAAPPEDQSAVTSKREILIDQALKIFNARGYHESSIEEIGAAAAINASSVYRYFPSKADLLAAVFYRANDRLAKATAEELAESAIPVEALRKIAKRYVAISFANPELLSVYFAEFGNLPEQERTKLRALQRQHIEEWVHLLCAAHPDTTAVENRFRVHAALGLVLDVGRSIRFDTSQLSQARVSALLGSVLLLDNTTRRKASQQ